MKDLESIVAVVVDGESVSLAAALRHAKIKNGLEFLRQAADGVLIQRAIEREDIHVEEREIQRLMPDVLARTSLPEADAREEVRKTVAFGKLKGLVTDRMRREFGIDIWEELDGEGRSRMRDLLFLQWVRRERERAKVDLCLLREI